MNSWRKTRNIIFKDDRFLQIAKGNKTVTNEIIKNKIINISYFDLCFIYYSNIDKVLDLINNDEHIETLHKCKKLCEACKYIYLNENNEELNNYYYNFVKNMEQIEAYSTLVNKIEHYIIKLKSILDKYIFYFSFELEECEVKVNDIILCNNINDIKEKSGYYIKIGSRYVFIFYKETIKKLNLIDYSLTEKYITYGSICKKNTNYKTWNCDKRKYNRIRMWLNDLYIKSHVENLFEIIVKNSYDEETKLCFVTDDNYDDFIEYCYEQFNI